MEIVDISPENSEHTFKILTVGEQNAGKSSFVKRYIHDLFEANRKKTIGVDFQKYTFNWDENTIDNLHFWDDGGQERCGTQTRVFFNDTHGVFIICDVSDPSSIAMVRTWKKLIDEQVTMSGESYSPPCILLGNKIDLKVDKSEDFNTIALDTIASESGFKAVIPISNLNNYNIGPAVKRLTALMLDADKELKERACNSNLIASGDIDDETLKIIDGDLEVPKRTCGC